MEQSLWNRSDEPFILTVHPRLYSHLAMDYLLKCNLLPLSWTIVILLVVYVSLRTVSEELCRSRVMQGPRSNRIPS